MPKKCFVRKKMIPNKKWNCKNGPYFYIAKNTYEGEGRVQRQIYCGKSESLARTLANWINSGQLTWEEAQKRNP